MRECSNFIDLHVAVQFSQYHFLKRSGILSVVYSYVPCQRVIDHRCGFIFGLSIQCSWNLNLLPLILRSMLLSLGCIFSFYLPQMNCQINLPNILHHVTFSDQVHPTVPYCQQIQIILLLYS